MKNQRKHLFTFLLQTIHYLVFLFDTPEIHNFLNQNLLDAFFCLEVSPL